MKGLRSGQVQPRSPGDSLLVHDPHVVGEALFVGGSGAEQGRVAALARHVDDCLVADAPILWRLGASAQRKPQRDLGLTCDVLFGPHRGPDAEVVDEVKELVIRPVADDGREHLPYEAPFDAAELAAGDATVLSSAFLATAIGFVLCLCADFDGSLALPLAPLLV